MKTAPARPSDQHAGLPPGRRRTSHLEGAELDAAVAMAEGIGFRIVRLDGVPAVCEMVAAPGVIYNPSESADLGQTIIYRECIILEGRRDGERVNGEWIEGAHWLAFRPGSAIKECGPTAQVAAMRAYVAARLGPEVTLP